MDARGNDPRSFNGSYNTYAQGYQGASSPAVQRRGILRPIKNLLRALEVRKFKVNQKSRLGKSCVDKRFDHVEFQFNPAAYIDGQFMNTLITKLRAQAPLFFSCVRSYDTPFKFYPNLVLRCLYRSII